MKNISFVKHYIKGQFSLTQFATLTPRYTQNFINSP